tara:strand:+ start:390 stop:794 length:405 start_codon:yes stop_codon:yes gene_type:complete
MINSKINPFYLFVNDLKKMSEQGRTNIYSEKYADTGYRSINENDKFDVWYDEIGGARSDNDPDHAELRWSHRFKERRPQMEVRKDSEILIVKTAWLGMHKGRAVRKIKTRYYSAVKDGRASLGPGTIKMYPCGD